MSSLRQAPNQLIAGMLLVAALAVGCKENFRVGDYVLVDWCEGEYPAYITDQVNRGRYRVHFDGYEPRWDTEVGLERIKRRLEQPLQSPPPLCGKVARALGIKKPAEKSPASPYKQGARVRVTWRGSVYKATIIEVLDSDRFKVHYDGHESSWDEVVAAERIVGSAN